MHLRHIDSKQSVFVVGDRRGKVLVSSLFSLLWVCLIMVTVCVGFPVGSSEGGEKDNGMISGTLKPSAKNPRYFTDRTEKAIYLTGSHVWNNLQDWGGTMPNFNYTDYLDLLKAKNHNFIRLWMVGECTIKGEGSLINPMPWVRTGPGLANDGKPKFDLTRFDEEYFRRLRSRVIEAGERGIYVSIMLYDGIYDWKTHPFNIENNVNGIDGDLLNNGTGKGVHTLDIPGVTRLQERYIRKVIDTVNDLDNVLYEVGNEIKRHSVKWQYHIISYIHDYEKNKPKQHPVGMTSTGGNGADDLTNSDLFDSPADWISPGSAEPGQNYSYNPPPAAGMKVIISDTDHLWGILSNPTPEWVWKSFLRGLNPILMDVLQHKGPGGKDRPVWSEPDRPGLSETRSAMGQTLRYAKRINLQKMVPRPELSSTQYCLADAGSEYLIYLPITGVRRREKILQQIGILNRKIWVDLYGVSETFRIEWFNPETDEVIDGGVVDGGATHYFISPFSGDAILYLYRR